MNGFHWSAGWYFKRQDDGSVLILKAAGAQPDAAVVVKAEIPAAEWASIVASVSARGDNSETYQAAVALHQGD